MTGRITSYGADGSPKGDNIILEVDPDDDTMASTGTDKTVTLEQVAALVPHASTSAYGTVKPDGNSTHYLDGSGNWSAPAGGGGGGAVPGMNVVWMDAEGVDSTGGTSVTSIFNTTLAAQS